MDIYAVLSKKLVRKLESGDYKFVLPQGATIDRKRGSSACFITCEDYDAETIQDLLDLEGIPWQ